MAAGDAGHPMGVGEALIIAGIGCRKGTPAVEIETAVSAALARAGLDRAAIGVIATSAAKESEPGIAGAAAALGVPLAVVAPADLAAAGERVATRSQRVLALAGVPSVAEAAALAVGGAAARLIVPRIVVGEATCALVEGGGT
jgi:cobalt-precorrin 5A hydrolase